jgi:hypothetical protein
MRFVIAVVFVVGCINNDLLASERVGQTLAGKESRLHTYQHNPYNARPIPYEARPIVKSPANPNGVVGAPHPPFNVADILRRGGRLPVPRSAQTDGYSRPESVLPVRRNGILPPTPYSGPSRDVATIVLRRLAPRSPQADRSQPPLPRYGSGASRYVATNAPSDVTAIEVRRLLDKAYIARGHGATILFKQALGRATHLVDSQEKQHLLAIAHNGLGNMRQGCEHYKWTLANSDVKLFRRQACIGLGNYYGSNFENLQALVWYWKAALEVPSDAKGVAAIVRKYSNHINADLIRMPPDWASIEPGGPSLQELKAARKFFTDQGIKLAKIVRSRFFNKQS